MDPTGHAPLDKVLLHLVRTRLFFPLLAVSIAALIVAGFMGVQSLSSRQQQTVQAQTLMITGYLDQADRVLEASANVAAISDPEETRKYLQATYAAYRYYDTFYYLDNKKRITMVVPPDVRYLGLDMTGMLFSGTDDIVPGSRISRPFISPRTGNPTVSVIHGLPDGGYIAGELSLDALQQEIMASGNVPGRDFVFILDQYGTLLAHPSRDLVRQQSNLGDLEIFRQTAGGKSSLLYSYDGVLVFGSAARMERTGWVVVDQVPVLSTFGPYVIILGLIIGGGTLFWLVLGWNIRSRLRQQIVLPLEQLSRDATALAAGDYTGSADLPPATGSFLELDRLTEDFRHMNRAIQDRQQALERGRQELERRNEELHAAYRQLVENGDTLQKKIDELERFARVVTDRELKMIALKERIRQLEDKKSEKGDVT